MQCPSLQFPTCLSVLRVKLYKVGKSLLNQKLSLTKKNKLIFLLFRR